MRGLAIMLGGLLVLLTVSMTAQILSRRQLIAPEPLPLPTSVVGQSRQGNENRAATGNSTAAPSRNAAANADVSTDTEGKPARTAADNAPDADATIADASPAIPPIELPTVSLASMLGSVDEWVAQAKTNQTRDPNLHRKRGDALSAVGRHAQAARAYRMAATFDLSNANLWAAAGDAHSLAGEYADAATAYQRAVRFDPRFTTCWYNLGVTQVRLGDASAAIKAFRETLRTEPKHARAMHNLATLAETDGRLSEARSWWTRLGASNEEMRSEALAGAGRVTVRQGDVKLGAEMLTAAFLTAPGNTAAATALVDVRLRPDYNATIGKPWPAEPLLLWALAMNPYDGVAADFLRTIEER